MNTKEKLRIALKEAMKAGDNIRKSTIRLALSAIKNAEIEKKRELEETEVLAILQKEVKSRRETIEAQRKRNVLTSSKRQKLKLPSLKNFSPNRYQLVSLKKSSKRLSRKAGLLPPVK